MSEASIPGGGDCPSKNTGAMPIVSFPPKIRQTTPKSTKMYRFACKISKISRGIDPDPYTGDGAPLSTSAPTFRASVPHLAPSVPPSFAPPQKKWIDATTKRTECPSKGYSVLSISSLKMFVSTSQLRSCYKQTHRAY